MKIPYSPILPLVESHVAIYKLYVLKNPLNNNEIFYVGQTFHALETRLSGHISETGANREKINYIQAIINAGSRPTIEAVEVIRGTCYIDKLKVNEREIYWIRYYLALGCTLLNSAGTSPHAKCGEYHSYLTSLKGGKTSWHYYYCGKTAGGHEVYDEEKIKMDGFKFPEPEPLIIAAIEKTEEPLKFQYHNLRQEISLLKDGVWIEFEKKKNLVNTEIFPPQPHWSKEFSDGIIYDDLLDEIDNWDDADMEPDCDDEPEYYDEESELAAEMIPPNHVVDIFIASGLWIYEKNDWDEYLRLKEKFEA